MQNRIFYIVLITASVCSAPAASHAGTSEGRFVARCENVIAHELFLESGEEALSHGVVPAITLAAHALAHAMTCEVSAEFPAGILAAAVTVEDEARAWPAKVHGGTKRFADQIGRHAVPKRPANDPARTEVNNGA